MLAKNLEKDTASISVFRNKHWMGKKFYIGDNQSIQKQSNGLFTDGFVKTLTVPTSAHLSKLIKHLKCTDALCLGLPNTNTSKARVSTRHKRALINDMGKPCIARTKDDFKFADKEGWLLIDFDDKDLPEQIKAKLAAVGGIYEALRQHWPELERGDFLIKPSSSAGVHLRGTEPTAASGFHMFVRIKNAGLIPQTLRAMHARCWESGFGYHLISKSGLQLDRSLIDVSVGSPERLIFTADPILQEGILRTPPPTLHQDGVALEPLKLPLSSEWIRKRDIDRQRTAAKAQEVRAVFMEIQADRHLHEFGGTLAEVRAIVTARVQGCVLHDDDVLQTVRLGSQAVGTILSSMSRGDIIACADPIEGREYNPTAAAVIWQNNHKHPVLISHAHGLQTVYQFERFSNGGLRRG